MMTADSQDPAVILVHGLWLSGRGMSVLAWRLRRAGFRPHLFSYRSVRDNLRDNARSLRAFSDTVAGNTLHFVGQSLGGVIIQTMLAQCPPPRPGRIVTLGSPHRGAYVAGRLSRRPWGRRILGASIADLLRAAPSTDLPPRDIGVLRGNRPIGLGRLLFGVKDNSDGVVRHEESYLPGALDTVTLPVSHSGMLLSRQVAMHVCEFLCHGHFIR